MHDTAHMYLQKNFKIDGRVEWKGVHSVKELFPNVLFDDFLFLINLDVLLFQ